MSGEQAKMMKGDGGNHKVAPTPRVVIINTEYVETDAVSFKSVVQKLTGKHDSSSAAQQLPRSADQRVESVVAGNRSGVLKRDISFKDLDTLLRDMPTMDDLSVDY